jgi:hypothetical protein
MPSIFAARQIKPRIYTAEGVRALLRYISARFSKDLIPQGEEKSLRGQALALATLERLSGMCRISPQGLRHTLRYAA